MIYILDPYIVTFVHHYTQVLVQYLFATAAEQMNYTSPQPKREERN
jgi:hypothetical protein